MDKGAEWMDRWRKREEEEEAWAREGRRVDVLVGRILQMITQIKDSYCTAIIQ